GGQPTPRGRPRRSTWGSGPLPASPTPADGRGEEPLTSNQRSVSWVRTVLMLAGARLRVVGLARGTQALGRLLGRQIALRLRRHLVADQELLHRGRAQEWREVHGVQPPRH